MGSGGSADDNPAIRTTSHDELRVFLGPLSESAHAKLLTAIETLTSRLSHPSLGTCNTPLTLTVTTVGDDATELSNIRPDQPVSDLLKAWGSLRTGRWRRS